PLYSTVTTEPIDGTTLNANYWYTNLRQTVRFEETARRLLAQGHGHFIEATAHPVLALAVEEIIEAAGVEARVTGTLRRDHGGLAQLHTALATAWTQGVDVNWASLLTGSRVGRVDLPTYPFQRRRYWLEPGVAPITAAARAVAVDDGESGEAATALARALAGATEAGREALLIELVQSRVAAVLGHEAPETVDTDRAFKELGFDSLTAMQLRNRLNAATGLRLPATLVFSHPSPKALAQYLAGVLRPDEGAAAQPPVLRDIDLLEDSLWAQSFDDATRGLVARRLDALLRRWSSGAADGTGPEGELDAVALDTASDDELFQILDEQLGNA
ncbi:acyltransferase domain-containing protein, partial [Streptomyces sp. NPDC020192]|uniref:acyltransferase domain-containing protein n=1 Tax=Streptomyces sp. NPDC020192 TaxID=3365066 RepID=UPI0037888B63